ncbi:MAG: hypothetical protein LH630_09700, partial [Actinomycetia bacterium]|nr:hypothetical protein [Actinomycetes bacterium]
MVDVPEAIGGVPLHPLVVHAVVVLIPLASLGVVLVSLVPKWRARFGVLVVAAAAIGTAMVPIATSSGEQLEDRVGKTELVERHSELGAVVLYTAGPLLVMAVALWWIGRRAQRGRPVPRWLNVPVSVIGVLVAIAAGVQMVLV